MTNLILPGHGPTRKQQMGVKVLHGQIVIEFQYPTDRVVLNATEAQAISKMLGEAAAYAAKAQGVLKRTDLDS